MAFTILQTHLQRLLQIRIKAIFRHPRTAWLHSIRRPCTTTTHTRSLPQRLPTTISRALRTRRASSPLIHKLSITPIVHPHRLHNTQMRQRQTLRGTSPTKHIPAIPAMMLPVGECKFLPTPHANIAVGPLGRSVGVEHTAHDVLPRREVKALMLQRAVGLGNIRQRLPPLRSTGPILHQLQHLLLHIRVQWLRGRKAVCAASSP